ncbi:GNAT family N-acetyltransferase [Aureibacillus halotolerans]|uniref:Aminoglycoside 6'-N-acetyltransferase n=1 Tax=Aureibacillus halotolerans TaxID=1508390 RepID=A0A4R6TXC6_9BACI|nr:GNAT family N-acetyltransferase [Aureibacillus halotolerans]TDQ37422.1 aminoglycoside 6'-N-acetyltransferase [Aureibacillus halotolerans]
MDDIAVRPLQTVDIPLMSKWLQNEELLEFYEGRDRPHDESMVKHRFFRNEAHVERLIIVYRYRPIGYCQVYEIDQETQACYGYNDEVATFGMDQFIGDPSYWNRGIGQEFNAFMIERMAQHVARSRFVVDPREKNERAIACYTKCGFEKTRHLPQHELHEGIWENCWLMVREIMPVPKEAACE